MGGSFIGNPYGEYYVEDDEVDFDVIIPAEEVVELPPPSPDEDLVYESPPDTEDEEYYYDDMMDADADVDPEYTYDSANGSSSSDDEDVDRHVMTPLEEAIIDALEMEAAMSSKSSDSDTD
ncbi:uncharacterized protein LOC109599645 [Aethina tumida]|uniref:uncharacterized protein LOC109599645 n=1 Tax=Aethina tumida TaxID=116153 RepID=UPI00096ADD23|nr:uncharacterized protein LOC109599645 [Aethina tumida]XP_019871217.1 uncharacterized protein LOC109599645 [Aethina tumida]